MTTLDPTGELNVAPMGPRLFAPYSLEVGSVLVLKPFASSRTAANLRHHPEGVFHVTDDVLLLAQAAIGRVSPPTLPTLAVQGRRLADTCRAYEFSLIQSQCDWMQERLQLPAVVRVVHRQRDFFGFNRAKHAVVEAAILATRTQLLPAEQVYSEFERLAVLIDKTAGEQEREAFALLRQYVESAYARLKPLSPESIAQS
ncbi:MAG: DUF447 domain-containing protein [Gemmataceae bacterium]